MALQLSQHAKMRRKQMRVTEHRLEAVLSEPETIYPGYTKNGRSRTCYQREELVVIVQDRTGEVVTILFHGKEGR